MNVTCTLFFYSGLLPASKPMQLMPENQDLCIDNLRYDTCSLMNERTYLLCLLPQSGIAIFERKTLFKPENERVIIT